MRQLKARKHSNEQGKCPACNSDNLDYGVAEPDDECLFYPYVCGDCGFEGKEWYHLDFDSHTDNQGREPSEPKFNS